MWLPVCDYFRDLLAQYGYEDDKVQVLGSSIDCAKFKRTRNPVESDCIRCTTIARLVPKKGIEYALHAIARLVPHYPIKYTIIGDGKDQYKRRLLQLVRNLGIEQHVVFVGRKTHEEIIELLHDTDIYMQPSVTSENHNQEGIPNALKEAMSMELSIISTYHAGIPELVSHEQSGILVPEKNVTALRTAIERLIQDIPLRRKLGSDAREQALSYNINDINDQLHTILERLCEQA